MTEEDKKSTFETRLYRIVVGVLWSIVTFSAVLLVNKVEKVADSGQAQQVAMASISESFKGLVDVVHRNERDINDLQKRIYKTP